MSRQTDATLVTDAQKRASPELQAVAQFLRGKDGPKTRRGIMNGKRVDYFKGKTALRTLTGPAYAKLKKVPKVNDQQEAKDLLSKVLPHAFFLEVNRAPNDPAPGTPRQVSLAPNQSLGEDSYYAWFYEGSQTYVILGGIAMVVIMLAGVMFPLWPVKLRVGVWYLSIGVLCLIGAFIGLAIVRLIFWCITVISMKKAIWIFPNLFEDVGFVDSFIPGWAYDEPKKQKSKKVAGKKEKQAKGDDMPGAQDDGEVEVVKATAVSTGNAEATKGDGSGLRSRQAATVEEIEDEE